VIKVVGMDRDVDLLNYIKDGVVTATVASKSFTTKFMALHYVYWLRNDFMSGYLDWKAAGINPIPTITDTGNMIITQDNIQFFLKE
jgi:ABC-type sugar transport system substrate-binding protein